MSSLELIGHTKGFGLSLLELRNLGLGGFRPMILQYSKMYYGSEFKLRVNKVVSKSIV